MKVGNELAEALLLVLVIGDARDDHMAHPHRHALLIQVLRKREDALVGMPGQRLMRVGVDMLDVQHHKIGQAHEPVQLLIVRALALAVGDAGGVNAGVNPLLFAQREQREHEVNLQKRLAAGDGDAAVFVKRPVALQLGDNLLRGHLRALAHLPGIRVVAVLAAHGTALRKDHKAQARAVHRAEALD